MQELFQDLQDLLYPRVCVTCKNVLGSKEKYLCLACKIKQPHSNFFDLPENAMELAFKGRTDIQAAACLFYFQKKGLSQSILHHIKYKKNKALAFNYGKMMGRKIVNSERFKGIDYIFPVPMNKKKIKIRGYNQSEIIGKGIEKIMKIPCISSTLTNSENYKTSIFTSQTLFNKTSRLFNPKHKQSIGSKLPFIRKHILLIDDVVTTGTTLEYYFKKLKREYRSKISIATLAYTSAE